MAVAYNPTPIDFSSLATMGQNIGGALGQNNFNNAMRGALRPDGTFDFDKGIAILAQRNPAAAMKLQVDQETARALAGYRTAQAAAATANSVPDDLRMWQAYQREFGGGDPAGVEPFRLGPDGRQPPAFMANKFQTLEEIERQKAAGKAAGEQAAKKQIAGDTATKLTKGIQNLANVADKYGGPGFEDAVGPLQGAEPGDMLTRGALALPKLGGMITSKLNFSKYSPTEIRSAIRSGSRALAAMVKPLVRGPGEGTWTDKDQELLNSIVGDLAESENLDEYKRRLVNVVDALNSNFGVNIPYPEFKTGLPGDVSQSPAMDMATEPPVPAAAGTRGELQPRPVRTVPIDPVTGEPMAANAAPVTTDTPKIQKGSPQERQMLQWANEAIQQGADPNAVMQRLREMGIEQ